MTAIAIATAAHVDRARPKDDEVLPVVLAAAVTRGQVLYQSTAGFGVADANDSGKQQARGIALDAGAAGQTVSMLKRGYVSGFGVSALDDDAILYLSDTAGALDDGAGTMTVVCGRVITLSDTKLVYVDFDWTVIWS
jgi:hypothetical protein